MKVWEIKNIIADEHSFVLIDSDTCEEIVDNIDTDLYDYCDALEVRVQNIETIAIYINRPTENYETWLDVTYSIKIEAEVPCGCDREKFMREIAEKEIDKLPKTIAVNGGAVWSISDDNMQSGSFYDMIERC